MQVPFYLVFKHNLGNGILRRLVIDIAHGSSDRRSIVADTVTHLEGSIGSPVRVLEVASFTVGSALGSDILCDDPPDSVVCQCH